MELVKHASLFQKSTASLLASWEAKGTVVCQLRVGGQCWAFWAGVAPLCFEVPVDDAAGMLLHEHVPRQTPWTVPWFTCCLRAAAREPRLPCRLHAN